MLVIFALVVKRISRQASNLLLGVQIPPRAHMHTGGILFAIAALLSWGFGDFFIQRTVRAVGDFKALLFIGVVGIVGLFPFIYQELPELFQNPLHLLLLVTTGVIIFFAALFDFEALKQGKIAIIEPVLGIELPVVVALSIIFWGEQLSLPQLLLAFTTFVGIVLAATTREVRESTAIKVMEKGVILAGVGSIVMGLVNFLVGVSSQETSPLMAIWFTNGVFTILCIAYLWIRGRFTGILSDITRHYKLILAESILDNAAWIFFALSTSLIPIAIATTISESYIALTVFLGVFINKEKLEWYQYIGIAVTIFSVITLSAITSQ